VEAGVPVLRAALGGNARKKVFAELEEICELVLLVVRAAASTHLLDATVAAETASESVGRVVS
jgi:hypothetical protein